MAQIYVLLADWNSNKDPVPYYGQPPGACLDFNSRPAKPRVALTPVDELIMPDCEHGVQYDVVVCEVR